MSRLTTAIASTLLFALLPAPTEASPSPASSSPIQEAITEVIREYGGSQTAWNEVSWDNGEITLVLDPYSERLRAGTTQATSTASTCANGKHCAYGKTGYLGSKLVFSACPTTTTSFGPIGSVRSIKNSRSHGTVKAYNGSTLKTTLSPGQSNSNTTGITKITCA